jgi:hypothetical protein
MKVTWENWLARLHNPGSTTAPRGVSLKAVLLEELLLNPKLSRKALVSKHVRRLLECGFAVDDSDYYGKLLLNYAALFLELRLEEDVKSKITLHPAELQLARNMFTKRYQQRYFFPMQSSSG